MVFPNHYAAAPPVNYFPSEVTTDEGTGDSGRREIRSPAYDSNRNKEARHNGAVHGLQIAVMLAIIVVTAGIAMFGLDLKRRQQQDFERNFSNEAQKISYGVWLKASTGLGIIDALAAGIVSVTGPAAANQTWPYVFSPNFDILASKIMTLTPLLFVALHPLVEVNELAEFEAWSLDKEAAWIEPTLAIQNMDPNIADRRARYANQKPLVNGGATFDWASVNSTWYVCLHAILLDDSC
jgi:hypothetical protein